MFAASARRRSCFPLPRSASVFSQDFHLTLLGSSTSALFSFSKTFDAPCKAFVFNLLRTLGPSLLTPWRLENPRNPRAFNRFRTLGKTIGVAVGLSSQKLPNQKPGSSSPIVPPCPEPSGRRAKGRASRQFQPYSFAAFRRSTISAMCSACGRVISPSAIIPLSAIASALRADSVVCQPISSQPISGVPGERSVPNSTFSGYHSSQYRSTRLSSRVGTSQVCSEKSVYTFGFISSSATAFVYGPAPPCSSTNFVLRSAGSSSTDSSSSGFAPASWKYPPQPYPVWTCTAMPSRPASAATYRNRKSSSVLYSFAGGAPRPIHRAKISAARGFSAGSKSSARKYAASNFTATAPAFRWLSSVGVTICARYSSSIAGGVLFPCAFTYSAKRAPSRAKKIARSGVVAASALLFRGKRSASSNGTQRNRGGVSPRPIATRFASSVSIPSRSSTHAGYFSPCSRRMRSFAASNSRTCSGARSSYRYPKSFFQASRYAGLYSRDVSVGSVGSSGSQGSAS